MLISLMIPMTYASEELSHAEPYEMNWFEQIFGSVFVIGGSGQITHVEACYNSEGTCDKVPAQMDEPDTIYLRYWITNVRLVIENGRYCSPYYIDMYDNNVFRREDSTTNLCWDTGPPNTLKIYTRIQESYQNTGSHEYRLDIYDGYQDKLVGTAHFDLTIEPQSGDDCIDSDGGKDYENKGVTMIGSAKNYDYCTQGDLIEYYCSDGEIDSTRHDCGFGLSCYDGECVDDAPDPNTYKACVGGQCKLIYGDEEDECFTDLQCKATHFECENEKCSEIDGSGENTCLNDLDCVVQTHAECRENKCVTITGEGIDKCSSDEQCESKPKDLWILAIPIILVIGGIYLYKRGK